MIFFDSLVGEGNNIFLRIIKIGLSPVANFPYTPNNTEDSSRLMH